MGNRILLADDSITIQKVVNLTFADEGIEVVAVSNGDQAERRLGEVRPDLVLADIFMPGKNGYELCEAIKQSPQYYNVPVVLLVGAFEPFDQAEARRVKADAHLTKPFESRTLVDTVRKLISASSQPRTGPLPPLPVPDAKAPPLEPLQPQFAPPFAQSVLEPHNGMPVPPAFDLELSGPSSDPAAPAVLTPPAISAGTMDFNYGSSEDPLAMALEMPLDMPAVGHSEAHAEALSSLAPASGEPVYSPTGSPRRRTDELSFVDSQPPFESFGGQDALSLNGMSADVQRNEVSDMVEASSYTEHGPGSYAPESTAGVPSKFGYAAEEMLLDFDPAAPASPRPGQAPYAFNIEEREAASVDATGIQADAAGTEFASEAALKTTLLEMPPAAQVESKITTNPLEAPAPAPLSSLGDPGFAASVLHVDEAALFNVEDPLGDVLDESLASQMPAEQSALPGAAFVYTAEPVAAEPAGHAASNESLSAVEALPAGNDVPDLAAPYAPPTSVWGAESLSAYEPAVEYPGSSAQEPVGGTSTPYEEALASHPSVSDDESFAAGGYGDFPDGGLAAQSPSSDEAKFTTDSMWSAEDARFAAIDIEATPVDELIEPVAKSLGPPAESVVFQDASGAYNTQPSQAEPAHYEAHVDVAMPVQAVEQVELSAPRVEEGLEANRVETAQPAGAGTTAELSPALIDEIVRRVVSQLSEAVVREIAWEVVPDCVERVIKEMTGREVSQR